MLPLRSNSGRVWIVRRRARRIGLTPRRIASCDSGPTSLLRIRRRRLLCLCQIRSPYPANDGTGAWFVLLIRIQHCTFAALGHD